MENQINHQGFRSILNYHF